MSLRFLIDAQLSRGFGRKLQEAGYEWAHVNSVGLGAASDAVIWLYAGAQNFVLVTKDRDFVQMTRVDPAGPQVVWLRHGNSTTRRLWAAVQPILPDIIDLLRAGERVVEVS